MAPPWATKLPGSAHTESQIPRYVGMYKMVDAGASTLKADMEKRKYKHHQNFCLGKNSVKTLRDTVKMPQINLKGL